MTKSDSSRWLVAPGAKAGLAAVDTRSTDGAPGDKAATESVTAELHRALAGLQERLYAEGRQSLLVVLQALDAGGKDGTIKHVFGGLNPSGCRVASFKAPSEEERSHDFLWRIHTKAPAKGEVVVFNRSHYEDVLVVRVHELVPEGVWRPRYGFITAERFRRRLEDPTARWKFRESDIAERPHWDEYMVAFEEAISATSTAPAPWYVIPADRKWYRNWAISRMLIETLEDMGPQYPPAENLDRVVIT